MTDRDGEIERWSMPWAWLYSVVSGNPRSNREVVHLAEVGPEDHVLDVGCGPGAAVRRASRRAASAVGVDPSPAMVRIARSRSRHHPQARFEVGDAAHLPLEDASITVAWTVASWHHWPEPSAGLAELRRVLVPGGRLLVLERRLRRAGGHGMAETEVPTLQEALTSAGFTAPTVTEHRPGLARMLMVRAEA